MANKTIYELKMFSSLLEGEPDIRFEKMDVTMTLRGNDDSDERHECTICFKSVVGFDYSLAGFSRTLDAYDKVVELSDSDWKKQYQKNNADKYNYWMPRHFALYLDGFGLYQFLAKDVNVEEM